MADDARVHLVKFDTETESQPRMVRSPSRAGLQAGAYVFVEMGATWTDERGTKRRINGRWVQCVVERQGFDGIHVRRAPDPNKAPAACG